VLFNSYYLKLPIARGRPAHNGNAVQTPRLLCFFNFYYLQMLIARGRPAHKGNAVQTPRGHLSFYCRLFGRPRRNWETAIT